MFEATSNSARHDMQTLVKDAQALFESATSFSGEKADEMRARGMQLLDSAVAMAQQAQHTAMVKGKEMAISADHYVKENPWRMIGAAAGVGVLIGLLINRK